MNEWFAPQLEDYQDPNVEVVWKRPPYDPWIDEVAPPVDETYLRGRQPSDDPYSEIRRPRTLSETANFNIPYAEEMRDMLVPPLSNEEAINMYNPGGMVKWAGKIHPNAYVFRGMGNPTEEVEALRELIGKSQKIVTPIEQAGSLISPKFVKRAQPEGVLYDADTAMGDIGNIGISDTYSSYYPEGKMFRTENIDRALGRVESKLQGDSMWTQGKTRVSPSGYETFETFPTEKAHRYNYAKDKLQEMQQGIKESDTFSGARRTHLMRDPKETSLEEFFTQQGERYANAKNPSHAYSEVTNRLGPNFENRMAGVNVNPENPNEALLQLAKDRNLKVFGLPYRAEKKATSQIDALDKTRLKLMQKTQELNAQISFNPKEATEELFNKYYKYKNAWEKTTEAVNKLEHEAIRQPWKGMMTAPKIPQIDSAEYRVNGLLEDLVEGYGSAEKIDRYGKAWEKLDSLRQHKFNPTGGEWVSRKVKSTKETVPAERNYEQRQQVGALIADYMDTGLDWYEARDKALKVLFPDQTISKSYLTSSELPGNVNYKYSGYPFPSE